MCGIAGHWLYHPDLTAISRMVSALTHRGPDDSGVWRHDSLRVALGHTRLSIIDLTSLGHQPMSAQDSRIHIVFNGEIYNYRELRRDLSANGAAFISQTDTEVLLNLYARYGTDMLPRLNGIFAFAIYDETKRLMFLARDHLGVKPLYYSQSKAGFLFASEIKSILQSGMIERRINPKSVFYHLGYLWSPAPETVLAEVSKLEPGSALLVEEGRIIRQWRHFDFPCPANAGHISVDEATITIRDAVKAAVQRQLVADVPIGAFLSGGLDSSAVVAMAARIAGPRNIDCFTVRLNDQDLGSEGFASDFHYAKKVARHLGVPLHFVEVGSNIVDHLEKTVFHLDEPTADPAAINTLLICTLARAHNIKVLLSGSGGDDIFTGYRRHYALQCERYWDWLPAPARHTLAAAASRLPASPAILRRLAKAFRYAGLGSEQRIVSYFFWLDPVTAYGLLDKSFAQGFAPDSLFSPLLDTLAQVAVGAAPLDRMLFLECKHFLADHNLHYTDKMGMACGVEVRVPLLDLELVQQAFRLDTRYKQHGRTGKWIFKRAMEEYLPAEVIYRPKTGFGLPLRRLLKGALRPMVRDILASRPFRERGIFDVRAVDALLVANDSGRVDASYTIFSLLTMELWCRRFVDQVGVDDSFMENRTAPAISIANGQGAKYEALGEGFRV